MLTQGSIRCCYVELQFIRMYKQRIADAGYGVVNISEMEW